MVYNIQACLAGSPPTAQKSLCKISPTVQKMLKQLATEGPRWPPARGLSTPKKDHYEEEVLFFKKRPPCCIKMPAMIKNKKLARTS